MVRRLGRTAVARVLLWAAAAGALGGIPALHAAETAGARVNRVWPGVKLETPGGAHAAKAGDLLADGAIVRTDGKGRVELTLPGSGVARLGDKSSLKITDHARTLELLEGLMLFETRGGGASVKITTGSINVAGRGGTGLIERNGAAYVKILVLEGEARVYTSQLGESVVLTPGQLLITGPSAKGLAEPVYFAIEQLYKTSLLMNSGFAPLASRTAILQAIQKQQSDPHFVPTNLMIFGRGTLVNLLPPSTTPKPRASAAPKKP
ncbi:MAG: FecR domain-containing protein [Chthoniobacterales bacterium]